MENKHVGFILLGISVIVIIIILLFNSALKDVVNATCSLEHGGDSCPMYSSIEKQTYLAFAIVGIIVVTGIVFIFSKPSERIIVKKVKEKAKRREYDLSELKSEEKQVFNLIKNSKAIFQADIIDKTGFGKAKMTRIIDRLEGNNLVERKRRGMTNIVVLKS